MEMDDEAEVIDPYMDDGSNNPPPLNSEDEETPPTSPVIPDADGKMETFMSERIDTEGRIKKKFKEQDRHYLGLGCDNIEMDRTVRKVMSDLSGLKKLVKGLSDRFDEYKRSKVFDAKRVLEKELVNERNGKKFYLEFGEYMCRMLQNHQKSEGSFPLPLGSTMPPRKSTRGNPPPPLIQDTMNRMIQESVEAAIRAERERVATLGIEVVTRKTWAEMKVMTTEEFFPPEEIQRMEGELWNLRVKEMDISSYTTRFNELVILCPGMVPTE
nr:hypothetical protein [Tanacetum cinerariifolium]